MRIIKEGEILRFECEVCGCIFEEAKSRTQDFGFYIGHECPCCGEMVKYYNVKEGPDNHDDT